MSTIATPPVKAPRRARAAKENVSDRPTFATETQVDRPTQTEPVNDPITHTVETPEERAAVEREERARAARGDYDIDPALRETHQGATQIPFYTESYMDPDKDDISSRIAAARSGAHRVPERAQRVFEAPAPDNLVRPSAPLLGERPDEPFAQTIEPGNRISTTAGDFVADMDEIDSAIGSNRRRLSASFDWARERLRNERHVFTRHYYDRGVLVDRFAVVDRNAQIEAADKAAAITRYNADCEDPRQKIGYLALLAETVPTEDQVKVALERGIVIAFSTGDLPERQPIGPEIDNRAQLATPRGSVRFGLKTVRGESVPYYHDAMKGIFTAHVLGSACEGRSVVEVDAKVEAAITAARARSAAIDETVTI